MHGVQQAKWEMIEAGGRTAQSFGLNRLLGQIYMLLYLTRDPQSLDGLSGQLGVSKASLSIACRQLEGWGALRRVWVKGDRKDYYEAETDLRRLVNNGLMTSISKKLDSAKVQIEISLSKLGDGEADEEQVEFLKERLLEAERYRSRIVKLVNNPIVKRVF